MTSWGVRYLGAAGVFAAMALSAGCAPRSAAAAAGAPAQDTGAGAQVAQAAVAPSDPTNLLIGSWRLASYTPNGNLPGVTCTMSTMTFTASQVTQANAAGASSTIPVSYIAEPTKVFVVTDAGITNAADYLVLDRDDVQLDAILGCTYHRVA